MSPIDFNSLLFYFQNLPALVSLIDFNGNYIFCNILFKKKFLKTNKSNREIIGKSNHYFFSDHDALILDSNNFSALKLGGTNCFEEIIKVNTVDSEYWLTLKKPVLDTNGKILFLISVSVDITQKKHEEQKLGFNIFGDQNQPYLNYIYGDQHFSYLDQGSKLISKPLSDYLCSSSYIALFDNIDNIDDILESNANFLIEFFEVALLNFPGNIYVKDSNFVIDFINLNLCRDIGVKIPKDVLGLTLFDILPHDIAQNITDMDVKLLSTDEIIFDEECVQLDGNERNYISYKKSVFNPYRNERQLIGISIDFTLQKQLERNIIQALKKQTLNQQAKETFITNISHDIRTPITGMLGLIADMKSKVKGHPEILNKISTLEVLTNEFLNFFNGILESAESNEVVSAEKNITIFDIRALVESSINLFKPSLMYQNVDLFSVISKQVPQYMKGNARIIKQIIINLVGNAVKFTDKGEIKVILNFDSKKSLLEIIISDSGIGINQTDYEKIFERFTRLDLSPNSKYSGSGLGLYMVKKFIHILKGSIVVKSKLGQGTSFCIKLPIIVSESQSFIEDAFQNDVIKTSDKSVLVLEDNQLAGRALQVLLEQYNLSVTICKNAKDGIDAAKKTNFSIIFIDLDLPDQHGLSVIEQMRDLKQYVKTPMFILSGYVSKETKEKCFSVGANEAFEKPLRATDVIKILEVYA